MLQEYSAWPMESHVQGRPMKILLQWDGYHSMGRATGVEVRISTGKIITVGQIP